MAERPKSSGKMERELDNLQNQFDRFDDQVKSLSTESTNSLPIAEQEQQTKLSNREMRKMDIPYIKPLRSLACKQSFDEKFRKEWDFDKQYIECVVENLEIIGEAVECWSKPYRGVPYENWRVPVNKPVMIPRYLAEQLSRCNYIRYVMEENKTTSSDGMGTYYGAMAAKERRRRLDCRPTGFGFVSMANR